VCFSPEGTSESGKSKLKHIFGKGFSLEEKQQTKRVICRNVVTNMQTLLRQAQLFGYSLKEENKEHEQTILLECHHTRDNQSTVDDDDDVIFSKEVFTALKALWKDPAICQETMGRYQEFQLTDSASSKSFAIESVTMRRVATKEVGFLSRCQLSSFFERLDELSKPDYLPVDDDMIRVRIPTNGVTEVEFNIDDNKFT